MPDFPIDLSEDEVLLRIFHRYPNQLNAFNKLLPGDFLRNMPKHSGISLWRLKYTSRQKVLESYVTEKLKGLAACTVGELKDMNLSYFVSSKASAHVSARCSLCNGASDYPTLCVPNKGECAFMNNAAFSQSKVLTKRFRPDTAIKLP